MFGCCLLSSASQNARASRWSPSAPPGRPGSRSSACGSGYLCRCWPLCRHQSPASFHSFVLRERFASVVPVTRSLSQARLTDDAVLENRSSAGSSSRFIEAWFVLLEDAPCGLERIWAEGSQVLFFRFLRFLLTDGQNSHFNSSLTVKASTFLQNLLKHGLDGI